MELTQPIRIRTQADLKALNTFGIPVRAQELASFSSVRELLRLLDIVQYPPLILGGGSNILFTKDQDRAVLVNDIKGIEVQQERNGHVYVRVGGGVNWHQFVLWAIDQDLGGIENLSLIPGHVGAAPIQNIGAYGVEQEAVFDNLEAVELATGRNQRFGREDCDFGYRHSVFKTSLKGQYCITHVTFKLSRSHQLNLDYGAIRNVLQENGIENPTIRDVSDSVIAIRRQKLPDPAVLGNAGSFFKNPEVSENTFRRLFAARKDLVYYPLGNGKYKIPAGWLIDQCGWKGKRRNGAGCYKNQALVLVNHGHASGEAMLQLARLIQADVMKKFGIDLLPEVNIL